MVFPWVPNPLKNFVFKMIMPQESLKTYITSICVYLCLTFFQATSPPKVANIGIYI